MSCYVGKKSWNIKKVNSFKHFLNSIRQLQMLFIEFYTVTHRIEMNQTEL